MESDKWMSQGFETIDVGEVTVGEPINLGTPETWKQVEERLNKPSDCAHDGLDCEIFLTCSANCSCKACLEQRDEASADPARRRDRIKKLLDTYRNDHGYMFAKRRDHEEWEELVRAVLLA